MNPKLLMKPRRLNKPGPCQAIMRFCLDCIKARKGDPANCTMDRCPLFPYRQGHNPARKGIGGRR